MARKATSKEESKVSVKSLEESMERLEGIIGKMEGDGDLSLEEMFTLYGEGMKLVQTCNASIDGIEKKMATLTASVE
jgi:exodeoxyribonuclease VII small subunit